MSVSIAVNGLTICHKGSAGKHTNSAPDVCRTPSHGVPVPYSIIAMNTDLVKGTETVKADGGNMIAIRPSEFARCTGDEAGSMGGVISGTTTKQSNWITYSPNVYAEGDNICRLSDKLFMNNRNTISGNGGQGERTLGGGDAVFDALCEIFCEAREEWHACRSSGRKNCSRPSVLARDKVNASLNSGRSGLRQALGKQIGAAERTLYATGDKIADIGRKFYTQEGLERAVKRAVRKAIKDTGVDRVQKMGRKFWLRAVPGLGQLLTGVDAVMTAVDIYNVVDTASKAMANKVRIQPDFVTLDATTGEARDIYDFKFDAPGYKDEMGETQRRLYRDVAGGTVKVVDSEECGGCGKGKTAPSIPGV
ncbi:MAG: DUF4150 domain-containing protein [Shimia sp.]